MYEAIPKLFEEAAQDDSTLTVITGTSSTNVFTTTSSAYNSTDFLLLPFQESGIISSGN